MIGKKLVKLRKLNRLTQEKAAKGIISLKQYSAYETGRSLPSKEILSELAKRFQVPVDYLVDHDKEDPKLHSLLNTFSDSLLYSDIHQAKHLFSTIKESFPYIPSYRQELLFLLLQTIYHLKNDEYDEAQQVYVSEVHTYLCDDWLSSNPIHLRHYLYIKARIKFYQRAYQESYNTYLKLLELEKNDLGKATTHYNLSLVLFELNQYDKAISHAETSLLFYLNERRSEEIPHIYHLLGLLHFKKGDCHSAERFYQNALSYAEQYSIPVKKGHILYNLGLIYKHTNHFDRAIEFLTSSLEVLQQHPDVCRVYETLAKIYLEDSDLEKVNSLIDIAMKCNCSDEDKNHLKVIEAKYELKAGNPKRYEELLEKAAKFFEEQRDWEIFRDVAKELGEYYLENKAYKRAATYFKLAIESCKEGRDEI